MRAAAETFAGGTEGQALDIRKFNPRVSHGDLIVFALALLLVSAGGLLKQIHDNRAVSAEVGRISVTYPRGWFRYPVKEPEQLRVVSNQDGDTSLRLVAEPAGQVDLLEAVVSAAANPAVTKPAYVQLANKRVDLRGELAFRTDYADVHTSPSGAFPPEVIRGLHIAWIINDQVHVLTLESPDIVWDQSKERFAPIVGQLLF